MPKEFVLLKFPVPAENRLYRPFCFRYAYSQEEPTNPDLDYDRAPPREGGAPAGPRRPWKGEGR
jgi:hypothetical protein